MDSYTEQILGVIPSIKRKLMLVGSVLVILLGVVLLIGVSGSLGLTAIIIGMVLFAFAKNALSTEYEYAFTNGDCDIARITNKASRKNLYSFEESSVLRILPYDSDKFQNELQVNAELAIKNFTSGFRDNTDSWYAFLITGRGGTTAVLLELNEKSLTHIQECYKQKLEQ